MTCALGRDNQPTACSLYPLGELWKSPRSGVHFYSLDNAASCEGLQPGAHRKATTVGQYLKANGIPARQEQWEWFQRRATQFAAHRFPVTAWQRPGMGMGPEMPAESQETINASMGLLHDLFFNFDALPVAPEGGFQEWSHVVEAVEKGLGVVTELSQVLRDAHYLVTPQHDPEAWISLYEQCFYAPLIEAGYVVLPTDEETQQYDDDLKAAKLAQNQQHQQVATVSTKASSTPVKASGKKKVDPAVRNRMPSRK